MANVISAVKPYWPAVVAGLYLAYVVAAGKTDQILPALSTFAGLAGLNHSAASAHARIAAMQAGFRMQVHERS
jgi:hypothetical protein